MIFIIILVNLFLFNFCFAQSTEIDLTEKAAASKFSNVHFVKGFSAIEPWGVWVNGNEAQLEIDWSSFNPGASHSVIFGLTAFTPCPGSSVGMELSVYGNLVNKCFFSYLDNERIIKLSVEEKEDENTVFFFKIFGASSPREHGKGADRRKLGIGFFQISVDEMNNFDHRTITQNTNYFQKRKDFRKTNPANFCLFESVSYRLETVSFGEVSFFRSKGWFNPEPKARGGEVFVLNEVIALIGSEYSLIVKNSSAKSTDSILTVSSKKTGITSVINKDVDDSMRTTSYQLENILYAQESVAGIGHIVGDIKSPLVYFNGKTCLFRPNYFFNTHYYDFMLYYFPSIYFLSQKFPDMKFFMHQSLKSYEKEGLSEIGIPETQIIPIEKYTVHGALHASFESAYFTSFCNVDWKSGDDKEYFPEVLDFLRQTFLPIKGTATFQGNRKMYISRLDVQQYQGLRSIRSPHNEIEVTEFLKTKGFEIITLEGKTIREQAEIFSSCSAIIAPHGAGLTNIVFCNPGTKILEFFSPRWFSLAYIHLSSLLKLEHGHIMCDAQGEEGDAQANFYVRMDELQTYLELNGLSDAMPLSVEPSVINTQAPATPTTLTLYDPSITQNVFEKHTNALAASTGSHV
ncbi:MAG: glycosyltransferase family 61 protein [Candidatus Paracaedibacteraceae bacterium]|nr:glycosyltransferase family 61 protein [Candidatus Paracaedibacteraceae bacterium]